MDTSEAVSRIDTFARLGSFNRPERERGEGDMAGTYQRVDWRAEAADGDSRWPAGGRRHLDTVDGHRATGPRSGLRPYGADAVTRRRHH